MFKSRMLVLLWLLVCHGLVAQTTDSTSTISDGSIESYITGSTVIDSGFVNYYFKEEKHLLQIPDEVLGRDLLVSTTILKGAANNHRTSDQRFGYGGDALRDQMIRLVKDEDRIEILAPQIYFAEDSNWIYKKWMDDEYHPILASLKIEATAEGSSLIDITPLYESDHALFSLKGVSGGLGMGGYIADESYPISVDAHPQNINFNSIRAYHAKDPQTATYPTARWEVGVCWMLLPEKPMQLRRTDDRVGYFSMGLRGQFWSEDVNDIGGVVCRWRLEPKPEDMDKYLNGELVEPQKPIVFYIDRATPEYLVPYMIRAVNDWQGAFEQAGFKNAIRGELAPAPEENPEYSEADTRFSLISYKASPIANAYGPMTIDPRSGEVLSSHIGIFHTIMDLMQRWYFVMCAPVDPAAREYPLAPEVMGELARTVVSHEVGHTIGLFHNFIGSDLYELEQIRDHEFVQKNGFGASIMDYQRFNYLSRPEDELTRDDLLPRIGPYDRFAIEWGYRYLPDTMKLQAQQAFLEDWVTEQRKDDRHRFVIETDRLDPRAQPEDSGKDLLITNEVAIENLKSVMAHLEEWTPDPGPNNEVLRWRYLSTQQQYRNFVMQMIRYIAGRYTDNPIRGEEGQRLRAPIEPERQRAALQFIEKHFFEEPKWLFPAEVMEKTNFNYDLLVGEALANAIIPRLVVRYMLFDVNNANQPEQYTYAEMIAEMTDALIAKKCAQPQLSRYDRTLQMAYVQQLLINGENISNLMTQNGVTIKLEIAKIKNLFLAAAKNNNDVMSKVHSEAMVNLITVWETGDQRLTDLPK